MTIHFHIEYGTMFGEQLVLNIQEDDEEELKIPMATLNGKEWSVDWCVKQPAKAYTYYYSRIKQLRYDHPTAKILQRAGVVVDKGGPEDLKYPG